MAVPARDSTGDFGEALSDLLGEGAPGLSASTVVRLKQAWAEEHQAWSKRDLDGKHYVYLWADGIHSNVRLTDERACMLVIMGATADGTKALVAVHDGERESEQSWTEVLVNLKSRASGTAFGSCAPLSGGDGGADNRGATAGSVVERQMFRVDKNR